MRSLFMSCLGLCLLLASNAQAAITTLDLTTGTGFVSGTANIGGTFQTLWIPSQSTGTGVIDPFVRIQASGQERGYNTDIGTPLDDSGGIFTHSLLLGDVSTVTLAGTDYKVFLLDINEVNANGENLLSLNQIQFFTASADQLHTGIAEATVDTPSLISFSAATEVFRMSANNTPGTFTEILMDYGRNPGSGAGDMFLLVNASLFGSNPLTNVIMYSHFGDPPGGSTLGSSDGSGDGFEEWATFSGPVPGTTSPPPPPPPPGTVPEPGSLAIMGSLSLLGLAFHRFRRKALPAPVSA